MQQNAQRIGSDASMESWRAQQACGDGEGNAPSKQDEGLYEVQGSGKQAGVGDCWQNASLAKWPNGFERQRCGICSHSMSFLAALRNTQIRRKECGRYC